MDTTFADQENLKLLAQMFEDIETPVIRQVYLECNMDCREAMQALAELAKNPSRRAEAANDKTDSPGAAGFQLGPPPSEVDDSKWDLISSVQSLVDPIAVGLTSLANMAAGWVSDLVQAFDGEIIVDDITGGEPSSPTPGPVGPREDFAAVVAHSGADPGRGIQRRQYSTGAFNTSPPPSAQQDRTSEDEEYSDDENEFETNKDD